MDFNFEFILASAVLITGIIWLCDSMFFAAKRHQQGITKMPIIAEYAKSFFPVLLIVLLLRSFLIEPYRIPSGSDKPTLLVGDFIVANKFIYGLRLPVLHTKILSLEEPQIGNIALFRYPIDPSQNFIKRIIGGPGDRISYTNKVLTVNGRVATQTKLGTAMDSDGEGHTWPVDVAQEDLNGVVHKIYLRPDVRVQDFSLVVPAGQYFAMGDNRDDSNDSRYWGSVPEENFVGKAFAVWFSWDNDTHRIRWDRLGSLIH